MAADAVVSRELKSLQDELAAGQRERLAASAPPPASPPPAASADAPHAETAEERALLDQLRELANEVTHVFEEAEKNIAAHPAQSVIGALIAGILIGRLLGKR